MTTQTAIEQAPIEEKAKELEGKLVNVITSHPNGESKPRIMMYAGALNNQYVFVNAMQEELCGSLTPRGQLSNGPQWLNYDGERTFTLYDSDCARPRPLAQIKGENLQRVLALWRNRNK